MAALTLSTSLRSLDFRKTGSIGLSHWQTVRSVVYPLAIVAVMVVVIIVDVMAMAIVAVAAPIVAVGAPVDTDIVAVRAPVAAPIVAASTPVDTDIVAVAVANAATTAATVELWASPKAWSLPPPPELPRRTLSQARAPFASAAS